MIIYLTRVLKGVLSPLFPTYWYILQLFSAESSLPDVFQMPIIWIKCRRNLSGVTVFLTVASALLCTVSAEAGGRIIPQWYYYGTVYCTPFFYVLRDILKGCNDIWLPDVPLIIPDAYTEKGFSHSYLAVPFRHPLYTVIKKNVCGLHCDIAVASCCSHFGIKWQFKKLPSCDYSCHWRPVFIIENKNILMIQLTVTVSTPRAFRQYVAFLCMLTIRGFVSSFHNRSACQPIANKCSCRNLLRIAFHRWSETADKPPCCQNNYESHTSSDSSGSLVYVC